jgi:hypothetical protein
MKREKHRLACCHTWIFYLIDLQFLYERFTCMVHVLMTVKRSVRSELLSTSVIIALDRIHTKLRHFVNCKELYWNSQVLENNDEMSFRVDTKSHSPLRFNFKNVDSIGGYRDCLRSFARGQKTKTVWKIRQIVHQKTVASTNKNWERLVSVVSSLIKNYVYHIKA